MTVDMKLDISRAAGRPPIATASGIDSTAEAAAWLRSHDSVVRDALDEYGCLLIRGLPMVSVDDFALIRDAVTTESAHYREGSTPRSDYGAGVFSSTDLPASQPIAQHNENSYTLDFPGILVFGCLTAPETGGVTPVADVRQVLAHLPDALKRRFRRLGWMLVRNYTDNVGLPWQRAFGTDEPAEVERYCAERLVGHRWTDDGSLRTGQVRSAILTHPRTGEEVWFNHAAFWSRWALDPEIRDVMLDLHGPAGLPFVTCDGAGEELSEADYAAIRAAYDAATMREAWQPRDVLVVDNLLCSHGRDAFTGARQILVAMGDPVAVDACRPTVPAAAVDPGRLGSSASVPSRLEQIIGSIWCEVLRVPSVDAGADFFHLGGQSLLAMQVVNRLREQAGIKLPVKAIYDNPVLSDLVRAAEAA